MALARSSDVRQEGLLPAATEIPTMNSFSTEHLVEVLRQWASKVDATFGTEGIYLFGSLVFRDSQRFEQGRSDIDLLVILPSRLRSAPDRAEYLHSLRQEVAKLEKELLEPLARPMADKPICSVIAATSIEIEADVHKSNVATFFSRNIFLPLHAPGEAASLPNARTRADLTPQMRDAIAAVQALRNSYLGVSPNGRRKLEDWTGDSTIPKEMARSAAGLAVLPAPSLPGDEFDTRLGTSELSHWLYSNRGQSQAFYRLYDWIAARQNGGSASDDPKRLRPDQYLLLAEVIYDLARARLESAPVRAAVTSSAPSLPAGQHTGEITRESGASEQALSSSFVITDADRLAGQERDLQAAIAEATYNLDHRLEPAFTVAYSEALQLAEAIATSEGSYDAAQRLAQVEARQRRRELIQRAPIYESGFRFILFYQRLLFKAASREEDLRIALRAFAERVLIHQSKIGGMLQAWVKLENRSFVVGFSLGQQELTSYLASVGFTDPLELAAENQPLLTVPSGLLARYFVPELVFDYVAGGHQCPDVTQNEQDLFTTAFWNLGLK